MATASYTAPTDSLRERLTAMVMKDPLNAAAFSSPDQINETKAALNALGFTGPSSQPLAENGELDVETIIAYEKMRHSSSVFSDSAILREAEKALNRQGRSIPLEQNRQGRSIPRDDSRMSGVDSPLLKSDTATNPWPAIYTAANTFFDGISNKLINSVAGVFGIDTSETNVAEIYNNVMAKTSISNYMHNKSVDLSQEVIIPFTNKEGMTSLGLRKPTDSNGYIIDQGTLYDVNFGLQSSNKSGCGWIAIYNASLALGEQPDAASIIFTLENGILPHPGIVAYGYGGSDPFNIEAYFRQKGYQTERTFVRENFPQAASSADVAICGYIRNNFFEEGGHYVALRPVGDSQYQFYNTEKNLAKTYDPGKKTYTTTYYDDVRSMETFLTDTDDRNAVLITITRR